MGRPQVPLHNVTTLEQGPNTFDRTECPANPPPGGPAGALLVFRSPSFPYYGIDIDCSSSIRTGMTLAHPTGAPGDHTLSLGNTKTEHKESGCSSSFGAQVRGMQGSYHESTLEMSQLH